MFRFILIFETHLSFWAPTLSKLTLLGGVIRMFVFGGHVGRYAGRDDGALRTNKLMILHNAQELGSEEARTAPTWEKGDPDPTLRVCALL